MRTALPGVDDDFIERFADATITAVAVEGHIQ